MEPLAITLLAALALLLLLRRPGLSCPVLVVCVPGRWQAAPAPGDEDEQQPETDRAPRPWLRWSIAAAAAIRLVLLVTLHA